MFLSFILIQNRQGKTRLAKWYAPYTDEEKIKLKGEVTYSLSLRSTRTY
jgi:AP-2 complex subunit sigma-1